MLCHGRFHFGVQFGKVVRIGDAFSGKDKAVDDVTKMSAVFDELFGQIVMVERIRHDKSSSDREMNTADVMAVPIIVSEGVIRFRIF